MSPLDDARGDPESAEGSGSPREPDRVRATRETTTASAVVEPPLEVELLDVMPLDIEPLEIPMIAVDMLEVDPLVMQQ